MKNNLVGIIIPYFGTLPNYFNLWMESLKYNSNIDVIFLTDISKPNQIPENLIWMNTSFEDIKKRAQHIVDFKISLSRPYKLTDFKPAYGKIFADYLKKYDWWGFGDIDTIWGNLKPIINDNNLNKFDKILSLGHLTLLKNNEENNSLYKIKLKHLWNYRDAFSTGYSYHFDEGGGLSFIAKKKLLNIYDEFPGNMSFADLDPNIPNFSLAYSQNKDPYIFTWENGILKGYWIEENKVFSKEFTYVHLQKRSMQMCLQNNDFKNFAIIPNKFIPLREVIINTEMIRRYNSINNCTIDKHTQRKININKFNFSNIKRVILQKTKKIPVNGNEVYFNFQKPRY